MGELGSAASWVRSWLPFAIVCGAGPELGLSSDTLVSVAKVSPSAVYFTFIL